MSKKGAHPRRGNKRGYGRRRWRNKNWPAEGQPAPVVRSQGTPKPTWWLTFWKRSSRCTGCGNTTAPEEVVAYCHPGGWVLCQGCAEREGVWKLASLSRRLKAKERGGPPKGT